MLMESMDSIPLLAVFAICVLSMIVFIEIGFHVGRFHPGKQAKAQMAQVRAIMGASLGLLAFMLAFCFNMAQQHFEQRAQAYLLEVSAIDSAWRGAEILDDKVQLAAKDILRRFVTLRLRTTEAMGNADLAEVIRMVRESESMHDQLWNLALGAMPEAEGEKETGLFANAVLAMINAHDARLQSALFNRIAPAIWFTLFLMSLLSMIVMGYQAGLTGSRSRLATWTLAITFSAVMSLVADLDRPSMSLFHLDQGLMIELEHEMKEDLGHKGGVDLPE